MLNSPEHYLRPKTVTKQEVSTSYEVIDNALNVRSQLLITPNENRLSVATTMPSQIKCNRAKTCFRERPSNVNIASRVFAKTVNNQHVCGHTGFRIPPAVEKRQAVNGSNGPSRIVSNTRGVHHRGSRLKKIYLGRELFCSFSIASRGRLSVT